MCRLGALDPIERRAYSTNRRCRTQHAPPLTHVGDDRLKCAPLAGDVALAALIEYRFVGDSQKEAVHMLDVEQPEIKTNETRIRLFVFACSGDGARCIRPT